MKIAAEMLLSYTYFAFEIHNQKQFIVLQPFKSPPDGIRATYGANKSNMYSLVYFCIFKFVNKFCSEKQNTL